MKNSTSIVISLLGGAILGSVATCLVNKHGCKMGKSDIHKKIIDEIDQLRNFIAAHHPEEVCNHEDSACNREAKS
ncbi:MAG: hypothetical protein SNH94_01115 [Rikenellaceae bacterium]